MFKYFKFFIKRGCDQVVGNTAHLSIRLTSPHVMVRIPIDPYYTEHMRLAKAELKLMMIEAITTGEWEIVD